MRFFSTAVSTTSGSSVTRSGFVSTVLPSTTSDTLQVPERTNGPFVVAPNPPKPPPPPKPPGPPQPAPNGLGSWFCGVAAGGSAACRPPGGDVVWSSAVVPCG